MGGQLYLCVESSSAFFNCTFEFALASLINLLMHPHVPNSLECLLTSWALVDEVAMELNDMLFELLAVVKVLMAS